MGNTSCKHVMANELQEENIHFNSPPCIFYGNVFCAKATIVKRE